MSDPNANKIAEAQVILRALGFDNERCNERSALVLLALLELGAEKPWSSIARPLLRTKEIMEFIRLVYGKDYQPNTRETIRRQTLHQFMDVALVVINPDDPTRPINSPKNCYQVDLAAFTLIEKFGTDEWDSALSRYVKERPGLVAEYQRARELEQIPVTLGDGSAVSLTPGGQNVLLKLMVEEFCSRYTPDGKVLYIGDAGKEDPIFDEAALASIGVELDKHGKLPDLIVFLPDKNWLVLMEAAPTHGPVDAKRYKELLELFGDSSADLVLISCFSTRAEFRKVAADIAWETEVWTADHPDHLVHYNGDKFLGPYTK